MIMKYMPIAMVCLVFAGCGTPNMRHSSAPPLNVRNSRAPTPEDMVLIPAGTNSGTNPLSAGESYYPFVYPSNYSLTVSAFYMDKYEVTKAKWDKVYAWAITNGYTFDNAGSGKAENHPVHTVNWFDVVKWCNARSEMEGRPISYRVWSGIYRRGQEDGVTCATNVAGYRLPTVVEWEYAGRGGLSNKRFPWGDSDDIQHSRANYFSVNNIKHDTSPTRGNHPLFATNGVPYTSPVGSFAPNGYGLYDMVGNVVEWCWDSGPGYLSDPRLISGSWWHGVTYCGFVNNYHAYPAYVTNNIGFRVVLPLGSDDAP
jgi:formylglycine-generating enzyme required for sulfatase activity